MWAGNMAIPNFKSTRLVAATVVAMTTFVVAARSQVSLQELATPQDPLRPAISENQLFAELATRNERRSAALLGYTSLRTHQGVDLKGKVHAEEIGRMEYHAPDPKTFVVTFETGRGVIRPMALNPRMASEIEAASGEQHHDSSIIAENYNLNLIGEPQVLPLFRSTGDSRTERQASVARAESGSTRKTSPLFASKGILRGNFPSGLSALTLCVSIRRSEDSGFHRGMRRWSRSDSTARRL